MLDKHVKNLVIDENTGAQAGPALSILLLTTSAPTLEDIAAAIVFDATRGFGYFLIGGNGVGKSTLTTWVNMYAVESGLALPITMVDSDMTLAAGWRNGRYEGAAAYDTYLKDVIRAHDLAGTNTNLFHSVASIAAYEEIVARSHRKGPNDKTSFMPAVSLVRARARREETLALRAANGERPCSLAERTMAPMAFTNYGNPPTLKTGRGELDSYLPAVSFRDSLTSIKAIAGFPKRPLPPGLRLARMIEL